jgi:hypothetical protein
MNSIQEVLPKFLVESKEVSFGEVVRYLLFETGASRDSDTWKGIKDCLKGVTKTKVFEWLSGAFDGKLDFFLDDESATKDSEGEDDHGLSTEEDAEEDDDEDTSEGEDEDYVGEAGGTGKKRSRRAKAEVNTSAQEKGSADVAAGDVRKKKGRKGARKRKAKDTKDTSEKESNKKAKAATDTTQNESMEEAKAELKPFKRHMDLPPHFVDPCVNYWQWEYKDLVNAKSWPKRLSKEQLVGRMERNIRKLVYNWVAREYAYATGQVKGRELMSILSNPGHCKAEQKVKWTQLLEDLGHRCESFLYGCAQPPTSDVKDTGGLTFCAYFEKLLSSNYPGVVSERRAGKLEGAAIGKNSFHDRVYWMEGDVKNVDAMTLTTVDLKIHILKCQLLFDSLCNRFFDKEMTKELAALAFNVMEKQKDARRLREWSFDFNLLVHRSNSIDLSANKKALEGSSLSRGFRILEYLDVRSSELWAEIKDDDSAEEKIGTQMSVATLESRPSFREVKFSSVESRDRLKHWFFTYTGRLRPDLLPSIEFGKKHGLIRFEFCETQDVRYFIPIFDKDGGKNCRCLCALPKDLRLNNFSQETIHILFSITL